MDKRTIGVALICIAIGYAMGDMRERSASGTPVPETGSPRYSVSSYGASGSNGCYVIDSHNGQMWHVGSTDQITPMGTLPQQKSE